MGLDGAALANMGMDLGHRRRGGGVFRGRHQLCRVKPRMAEQLFGREGMVLIPVLQEGAAGFAAADAAAKKFGLSVDSLDAAKAIARTKGDGRIGQGGLRAYSVLRRWNSRR